MPNRNLYRGTSAADLGPFHGNHESNAVVYAWLTAIQAFMLFIFPWLVALTGALHHHPGHRLLSMSLWQLCFMDSLGLTTACGYRVLWKRLSAKIAEGGEDAPFLDQVCFQLASLVQGLVILFVISIVFVGTGGR